MRKIAILAMVVMGALILCTGSTWVNVDQTLTLAAVDATILDGTTSGRTYMASDRVSTYSFRIDERTDFVEVHFYSTGGDTADDTALVNIYGYGSTGPAMRVYEATTVTLGTAVAPGTGLYADTISGTDKHNGTISVTDESANTVAKLKIPTIGLQWLYFEPETFTGITNLIVVVRSYGNKQ